MMASSWAKRQLMSECEAQSREEQRSPAAEALTELLA